MGLGYVVGRGLQRESSVVLGEVGPTISSSSSGASTPWLSLLLALRVSQSSRVSLLSTELLVVTVGSVFYCCVPNDHRLGG